MFWAGLVCQNLRQIDVTLRSLWRDFLVMILDVPFRVWKHSLFSKLYFSTSFVFLISMILSLLNMLYIKGKGHLSVWKRQRCKGISSCISKHFQTWQGELSVSRLGHFTPGEGWSGANCLGGRTGPESVQKILRRRKSVARVGNRTRMLLLCSP